MDKQTRRRSFGLSLETLSEGVTRWAGSSTGVALAASVIVGWALTGPRFDYSDSWQLVINTTTGIMTFLMVFLIQRAQNKEALAVHLKLNEIVAALKGANNRLLDAEDLSEDDLKELGLRYTEIAKRAKSSSHPTESQSIDGTPPPDVDMAPQGVAPPPTA